MNTRIRELYTKYQAGTLCQADFTAALDDSPRQCLLILTCKDTSPRSAVFAWRLIDPRTDHQVVSPQEEPPYANVIEAMKDGWEVLQYPTGQSAKFSDFGADYIGFTVILQRFA